VRAAVLLATCARLGITLIADGTSLRVRGPRHVRDQLMPEIKAHKEELLTLLRQKSSAAPSPTHQKDVFGRWQDLAGLHGGGDALPN
jgi:hypothetical protein